MTFFSLVTFQADLLSYITSINKASRINTYLPGVVEVVVVVVVVGGVTTLPLLRSVLKTFFLDPLARR